MKNQKETIRRMVGYLNNEEKDGGFWLPNIQRRFVWKEEQIERLFDSIMREYPISTLLVWRTKSQIRRRKFIDNYYQTLKLINFYVPEDVLLTAKENGSGGKSNIPPEKWFEDKDEEYFDLHLIPKDLELCILDNYEMFIEARKELILEKFGDIIQSVSP